MAIEPTNRALMQPRRMVPYSGSARVVSAPRRSVRHGFALRHPATKRFLVHQRPIVKTFSQCTVVMRLG